MDHTDSLMEKCYLYIINCQRNNYLIDKVFGIGKLRIFEKNPELGQWYL